MQEVTTGQVLAFLAGTSPVIRFWERKHSATWWLLQDSP